MARELADIIKELDTVYNPLRQAARESYNKELPLAEQEMQAQEQGLMRAKENAFGDIETGANRRGMFFSGIPLKEQAKYVGTDFLPAVASLKNRYLSKKNSLYDTMMRTIAGYDAEAANKATGIRQNELALDEERRQFEARMAFEREQAATAAARTSGSGGGTNLNLESGKTGTDTPNSTPTATPERLTLRQTWQREANAGDWNAQVALNYAGDDGRYDGPVNSQSEYNILKSMGIQGNYYVPGTYGGW